MSYPKSLSEKSLKKKYQDAGLSESKVLFMKDLCLACMNLYGAIHATDIWDVYKELSGKAEVPQLHRKELYSALGIFRREDLPYYIFEADEIYSEEPRSDKYRLLASKQLVGSGYGKFTNIYVLLESSSYKPYFVPGNLMEYKDPAPDERRQKLIDWLSKLSCTQTEYESRYGETYPCAYTGKRLGEFSFISQEDVFDLQYQRGEIRGNKGNPKLAEELEAELNSMNAAERLVRDYTWRNQLGNVTPTDSIEYFLDDLTEMGVLLTEKQGDYLLQSLTDYHNHLHLWCNCGWTPEELARERFSSGQAMPQVQFGPGMQKAFSDGSLDREELIRMMKEMGLDVIDN